MTRLSLPIVLVCALVANACSSDKGSSPTDASTSDAGSDVPSDVASDAGGVRVTVSGTAAPHPLSALLESDAGTEFSTLAVAVVDPLTVLTTPTAPPLAGGALLSANCNGSNVCTWSFDNVDISGISIGLVGIIDDLRTPAASRLWVKTGTGAGSLAYIQSIRDNPMPIPDRRLFAVSRRVEAALATFAGLFLPDAAIVAGSLETRGFMIGTIIDRLSAGGTPVAGAMISVPPSETRVNILYPNDTFTGVGTSTASHGTFLVVPRNGTPPLTSVVSQWLVKPPIGSPLSWTPLMAGSTPGTCFVILFPADE